MFSNSTSVHERWRVAGEPDGLQLSDLELRGRWLRPALHAGTIYSNRAKLSWRDWLKDAGTERTGEGFAVSVA
jgi:hypothetical protein